MRKFITVIAAISFAMMSLTACADSSDAVVTTAEETVESESAAEDFVGMSNPWVESDQAGVLENVGFTMTPPSGATNVTYQYLTTTGMGQMQYEYDGINWVYRIQPTNDFEDISGMYCEWDAETDGKVGAWDAKYMSSVSEEEGDVQVVNWYEIVTGVSYSLIAQSPDLDGIDIQVFAEEIYEPLQGDVDGEM